MKIIIKAKDLKISQAIEIYLQKKLNSLKKFIPDFGSVLARVELGRTSRHHKKGGVFRAEINLSLGGKLFRAESEREDLYAAIDEVRDDLERELKKFKTKRATIFIRGARSIKKKVGISSLARFRKK